MVNDLGLPRKTLTASSIPPNNQSLVVIALATIIQSPSFPVANLVKNGAISDPITSWSGCVSMIGAQYDAMCGLPSNIMFINGRPKARVLCPAQNVAATTSPGVTSTSSFERKTLNITISDDSCTRGSIINSTIAEFKSNPIPLTKALQNAFQTMPRRTTCT